MSVASCVRAKSTLFPLEVKGSRAGATLGPVDLRKGSSQSEILLVSFPEFFEQLFVHIS